MPLVTPATRGEYDVIVVGSGAAGGQTGEICALNKAIEFAVGGSTRVDP